MINLRALRLKNGLYSLYLDIHQSNKRVREFLSIYVSEDYTTPRTDASGKVIRDDNGKPKTKNIKAADRDKWNEAIKIFEFRAQEIRNQKNGIISSTFKEKADFLEYFEKLAEKKNNKSYQYAFKHFKEYVSTEFLPFKSLDFELVRSYQKHLLKNFENNTAFIYLKRLQIAWNEAVREGISNRNPFQNLDKIKTKIPTKEYLELAELEKLVKTETKFKSVVRHAFLFACFTGLRISDIKALTWSNIQNDKINIRQKKSDKHLLTIPIPETAQNILNQLQKIGDKVFFGLPKNENQINTSLKSWAKQAGINKNLSFHCARHTFATLALTFDTDVYTVSKLLGHSSVATTQIYAKIIDSKKVEAMNKMPKIDI